MNIAIRTLVLSICVAHSVIAVSRSVDDTTSDAPSDVPSDVPSQVPTALAPFSAASPDRIPKGVLQSCPAGSTSLVAGKPYGISPIGSNQQETFCFEPDLNVTSSKVYCYTSCDDDSLCDASVNPILSADATIKLQSYGKGSLDSNKCTSANFYVNDEYCAVKVNRSDHDEGVAVTVINTLSNTKMIDWAGVMEAVSVTCSSELPPCRGPLLSSGVASQLPVLPAFQFDPDLPLQIPPVYADFCLNDIKAGDSVECGVDCTSSTCEGRWTIFLEKNFPTNTFLCKGTSEPCHLIVDKTTERVIVRVRATTNTGPLIDYAITCTINGETRE